MKKIIFLAVLFASVQLTAQDSTHKYWLARTTGKLPSLLYGLGDDRLGGAKMGYIDTTVLMKIVDSTTTMYRVQLAKNHSAYIEKQYIKKDSVEHEKPFYLTNSWSIKGTDTCYDIVAINMDERLPYKSWMEINPSKIMIDIYGVQSNTNWITQLSNLKEIKNAYYNQVEDDVVRVTIELKHQQHWGYSINYKNKYLVIKVKHQPEKLDIRKLKIAIDAGHGGTNSGADGVKTKAVEKTYTLYFAEELEKLLKKKGVKNIVMTRRTDTTFDMKDRVVFLQQENPDLLISLHLNSSSKEEVSGSSTYYKHIGFRPLSQAILKRMTDIKMNEYGNVGNFNFGLNAPTDFVNTLLEIAFLSNIEDEKKIIDPKFQAKVAKQVYLALMDWLEECKTN
jgi:N-acetylmuramoyl-L-alanine amidase